MGCPQSLTWSDPSQTRQGLDHLLDHVASGCSECGACVRSCAFLQHYGNPAQLARRLQQDEEPALAATLAFSCSLCGLCDTLCPERLSLSALFLQLRRAVVIDQPQILRRFRGLRSYENLGTSKRFTWHALPDGCQTVFFPGCALAGNRPAAVWQLYQQLRRQQPTLGLVLDCCTKPSHDLGDQQRFHQRFGQLRDLLLAGGVTTVLTACPNCYEVFRRYGNRLQCHSVYEELAGQPASLPGPPATATPARTVTVHDPCVNRQTLPVQQAVRQLLQQRGLKIEEMRNSGRTTLCCGEGGCVMASAPQLALKWRDRRAEQAQGRPLVTYCAGCMEFLRPVSNCCHVLDVLLQPAAALDGNLKSVPSLLRYKNRLSLKRRARQQIQAPHAQERPMSDPAARPAATGRQKLVRLAVLALLIGAIVALRASGLLDQFDPQQLRHTIAGYGLWAPLIFMLLYSLAPVFFLPGLPLTLLGGILFGPIWGVVYTLSGATAGASLAFLVARYLGRDWIATKLTGERWQKLDADVARQGWKMVAFTRLIPLFPFNLLNYAFGLTNIRFSHYVLTSAICMAPATVAYIALSSSLTDLLRGTLTTELLVGLVLLVLLALLPLGWKKWQARRQPRP
ncbi:MAG: VTT domain-containing protein [Desulfuromonas thiophila]|nr:VTT domain-containing protein [Desulfuromonas thiophila]